MNKSDPPVCVVDDDSSIREAIEGFRRLFDGHAVNIPATIVAATASTPA